jgi:hypothetical protein
MAKTQIGARVDAEIAELARKRAADRGMSVGDYLAHLVLEDASGIRARAMGAAERFLGEHQALFDEVEESERAGKGRQAA